MKIPHLIAVPCLAAWMLSLQAQDILPAQSTAPADTVAADTIFADTLAVDSVPPELPWDEALRYQLDRMVSSELFETTQLGMMIWDLDADSCLYRHHERHRLRPASTQKTVTAIAALDLLGGNYQFKTELRYSGIIEQRASAPSTLDPHLSTTNDTNNTNGIPSTLDPHLSTTNDTNNTNGIPSTLDPRPSSLDPRPSTLNPQPSTLNPQPSTLRGSLYLVGGMDPLLNEADIRAFAEAVKTLGVDTITGSVYEDRSFKHRDKWGEGWCWDDDNPHLSPLLVEGKDICAARLVAVLRDMGIVVMNGTGEAATPANALLICTRTSSIDEVLRPMMKRSDNWYAESLFYQIAAQQGGKWATVKAARNYIDKLVTRAGSDQKLIHVADGSGLSLYNYVTPDMEVKLLRYAWKKPEIIDHFYSSLPIAGIDGTLKNRMKTSKAKGNVHAKTGTVTGVSALAGYCTASNGHRLCFSIINQGIIKAKVGRDFQDRVCSLLCR